MSFFARLTLLLVVGFGALSAGPDPYSFKVSRHPYGWSTAFEVDGKHCDDSGVKKSFWRIRTCYDLVDKHGKAEGEGICRLLSTGLFLTSMKEIDLYDEHGERIGMIDGQFFTKARAMFSLYSYDASRGKWKTEGVAQMEHGSSTFTILPASGAVKAIATLKQKKDYWKVKVHEPDQIDSRLVRTFAVFVCDNEGVFCKKSH